MLSVALVLCLVCLLMVVHFLRSGRLASRRELHLGRLFPRLPRSSFRTPLRATPRRWLAVRSESLQAVQSALGLLRPRPCSWEEGLFAAQQQKLFISPPVDGWVLVMGSSLPEPAHDVDKCFHFILALSRKLGPVQFFSGHRTAHHHAWVWADHGTILRAYAWAGQTLWNQGRITQAELDLRLRCFDYATPGDAVRFDAVDPAAFNTERVPLLAARWSVDPLAVSARVPAQMQGIAGELSQPRNG